MGKKSSRRFRSKSMGSLSMNSIQMKGKVKKKNSKKMNKKIKKLFMQLRNDSDSSNSFHSANNSVIDIGENVNKPERVQMPDSNDKTRRTSVVILDDDDLVINNEPCPLQCSTPISKSRHSLKNTQSPLGDNNNTNSAHNFQQEVEDLTKEINRDSYLTIDLTNDTSINKTNPSQYNTVIDLANATDIQNDPISNDSLSMSGDSDVTVINAKRRKSKSRLKNEQMKKFAQGIANMDSSERGKLLEFIAQKIFKGSDGTNSSKISLHSLKRGVNCATETVEDTYIKEVILGQGSSRNSIGSNIYNPERDIKFKTGLRMIVIDGSNVAMQHTKGRVFSVKGLNICIDYFLRRGHIVKAFVPHFRCKYGKSTDGKLLDQLERQGLVVYTPSREIQGKMITSYDDRYIVQCAAEFDGVIVSCDNYRDLLQENPRWRHVIENRLLMFTWVGDMIMFPRDPLGRNGPTLENFLKHPDSSQLIVL